MAEQPDAPGCPHSGAVPDRQTIERAEQAVLCLLNAERARHRLGYLVRDTSLDLASQRHADDMAARNFFEHDTPEGIDARSRMAGAGYPAYHTTTAENLYWGEDEKSTPVRAHRSWVKKPRPPGEHPPLGTAGGRNRHRNEAPIAGRDFASLQREP